MNGWRSDLPPLGFENIYEKNSKGKVITYLRCKKRTFSPILKETIQCKYRIRKDHYKGSGHKCLFSTLDMFVSNKRSIIHDNTNHLDMNVYKFIGKKNIPISTAVSEDFYDLLHTFYIAGQNSNGKEFNSIYPKQSRATFTKKFIVNADHLKLSLLNNLKGNACLAIDGGKVGMNSILNMVVFNPLKHEFSPILYDGIYNFPGNYESYIKEVSRVMIELEDQGIVISGLITDNLKVQVMATDHEDPRSIQQTNNNITIKTSIRIPCQCHVASLSLNDLKKGGFLDGIEEMLRKVVHNLRSKKFTKWIGGRCPKICPTRWTNFFTILDFLYTHIQRLICILKTGNPTVSKEVDGFRNELSEIVFCILPKIYVFMFLYKKLIDILENNSTLAASCPNIYHDFFKKVQFFTEKTNSSSQTALGNQFINSFKNRLIKTGNFKLLMFLASFTIDGRNLLRENYVNIDSVNKDSPMLNIGVDYFILSKDEEDHINHFIHTDLCRIYEEKDQYLQLRNDFDRNELFEGYGENYSDNYDQYSDEMEIHSVQKALQEFSGPEEAFESNNNESADCINIYESISPLDFAIEFFQSYCVNLGLSKSLEREYIDSYLNWILHPIQETFPWSINFSTTHDVWNSLFLMKKYKELAKIALKYLVIGASEASAERMFSLQRFAISKHRYRTKKRLEESRMIYFNITKKNPFEPKIEV